MKWGIWQKAIIETENNEMQMGIVDNLGRCTMRVINENRITKSHVRLHGFNEAKNKGAGFYLCEYAALYQVVPCGIGMYYHLL